MKIELKGNREELIIFEKEVREKFIDEYKKTIKELEEEIKSRGIDPSLFNLEFNLKTELKNNKLIIETDYPERMVEIIGEIIKSPLILKIISGALKKKISESLKKALINSAKKMGLNSIS